MNIISYRLLILSLYVILQGISDTPVAAQALPAQNSSLDQQALPFLHIAEAPHHHNRCATSFLISIMQGHTLSPTGILQQDGPVRTRPTQPGEATRTGGFGHTYTTTPTFFDSPGGHFRIWYVTSGSDRPAAGWPGSNDADNSGVPDWIERCAEFFDLAWDTEINAMGYRAPPVDAQFDYAGQGLDDGGDGRYDVYIQDVAAGIAGYTNPESVVPGRQVPSYMVLDNDYAGIKNSLDGAFDLLRATVAHEFFHAIQFGYDKNEEIYWFEQSAVWMEEQVFSAVNDYVNYLGVFNGFLSAPWAPLTTQNGQHEFAGALWPLYLSQRFGQPIVRAIWENAETVQSLDAMDQALVAENSSLKAAFQEFTVWNVFTGVRNDPAHYYEEGGLYPEVTGADTTETYPYTGPSPSVPLSKMPSNLGSNYLFFMPDQINPGGLRIEFTGLTGSAEWGVAVVGASITGPDMVINVPLVSQQAMLEIQDWNAYDVIVLVVAVLNRTRPPGVTNFQYAFTVEYDPALIGQPAPVTASLANFPNPFNAGTMIHYDVPRSGHVVMKIYNTLGQEVRTLVDHNRSAGQFEVAWDGSDKAGRKVASGVYFSRLIVTDLSGATLRAVQKMLLIK